MASRSELSLHCWFLCLLGRNPLRRIPQLPGCIAIQWVLTLQDSASLSQVFLLLRRHRTFSSVRGWLGAAPGHQAVSVRPEQDMSVVTEIA